MPTLNQQQIDELSSIADKPLAQFTSADAIRYYEILHQAGFEYGTRALSVVIEADPSHPDYAQYSNLQGKLANEYSYIVADRNGVDFTVGNSTWVTMEHRLLRNDWADRAGAPNTELSYSDIDDNHTDAFADVGLPPETFTTHRLLKQLNEVSPIAAEFVWNELKSGDGLYDFFVPDAPYGAAVGLFTAYIPTLNPYEKAQGLYERGLWTGDILQALNNIAPAVLEDEFPPQDYPELWEALDLMQENGVADWLDAILDAATQGAIKALPFWMQALIGVFDDLIAAASPLVLDIDGDGIELAALNGTGSVYWDIDLDGLGEASGWIAGGDGLLAIDVNADGIINDHSELFGDQTGSPNGFAALAAYDTNSDSAITSADAQFDDLLVWIDANVNGYSEADELHTLDDLGITSISLNYSNVIYTINGNEIKQESTFVINGQTRDVVDAWFTYDETNTVYAEDYQIDIQALFLPSLRGFGNLPDLHIAMSQDATLLSMVKEVATADVETMLSSAFDIKGKVEDILFRWAGVDGVDPASRGGYIDARKMEFIEEILGREWVAGGQTNPQAGQADDLDAAFSAAFTHVFGHILAQTSAATLFAGGAGYDLTSASFANTDVDDFIITDAFSSTVSGSSGNEIFFYTPSEGAKTINDAGGVDTIVIADGIGAEDVRLWKAGSDLYLYMDGHSASVKVQSHFQSAYNNEVETLIFSDGSSLGLLENLTFTGTSAGGEYVHGLDNSDDTLVGMGGNDTLRGHTGNDTYVWNIGDGNDTIEDQDGTADVLEFGPGITADDVRFWKSATNLMIYVGSESIKIDSHFHATYANQIETATFTDDTVIDLLSNLTFTGTSANEYVLALYDSNDTVVGKEGNDTLRGYTGNDTYVWNIGDGVDTIDDSGGTADVLAFGPAITINDVRFWKSGSDLMAYVGSESVKVKNHFYSTPGYEVETATFDDGSSIDLLHDLSLTGTSAGEYVNGSEGSETLAGMGGNDTVRGYGGDDVLIGGDGVDSLYGGTGADTFLFEAISAFNDVDRIKDFSLTDGDMIDVADLLVSYDPLTDAIEDFVWAVNAGSNTDLYIDQDGAGTIEAWTKIATIEGVTGLTDEAALVSSGHLIAA